MVKLQKGKGAPNKNTKPRPLFPPGELPLFGPPPAFARRPPGPPPPPPPPRPRPLHHGGGYGPPGPPPPMSMRPLPPLVGGPPPPRPPIPPHPMRRRGPPGPPLPPPPLMGLPPRPPLGPPPPPFMRGPPRRPPGGPPGLHPPPNFRGRNDKMAANRRFKPNNKVKKKKSNRKPDDEGSFLCEPCDRSWFTPEELEEHLSCHEDCGAEHCSFSAHPKIVALHYKMQHASGLFEKIPKTYDAQDIAAWIAERKKRYPTKDKVEEKEAALKERVARGEVLEIPNSQPKLSARPKDIRSKRREFKNNVNSPRNKPQLQRRNIPPKPQQFSIGNLRIEVIDGLPPDYETNKREAAIEREKALAAVEEMKNQEDPDQDFISEDDWEVDDGLNVETPKAMSSVLSALSAAYDSNISDDDGPPIELNTVVSRAIVEEEKPNIEQESECIGDPQTLKDQTVNDPEGVSMSRKRTRKRPAKGSDKKPRLPPPAPSSLLQMLLAHDIRKERNQILQCVRFIVDNDYFDQECRSLASTIAPTAVSVS